MVTPTFFAGACVVVAAVLAYGTTQTHLIIKGMSPACGAANCVPVRPGAGPGVQFGSSVRRETPRPGGSASSGARARARTPATGRSAQRAGRHAPRRDGGQTRGRTLAQAYTADVQVIIAYQTVRAWRGGFDGAVTITNRSRSAIPNWLLWLRYRRARLDHVWGARWYPVGRRAPGAGVIAAPVGQLVLRPRASTRFTFRASGHAGPPDGCFFDTSRCGFARPR